MKIQDQLMKLIDLGYYQQSCSVYPFYVNKLNSLNPSQPAATSYLTSLGTGLLSLFSQRPTAATELAFFNSEMDKCNDAQKAMCHLVRGVAASTGGQHVAGLADYNFAISLFPATPENLFPRQIAYYNRGYTHLELKQYDKAFNDFEKLKTLLWDKDTLPRFEKIVTNETNKLHELMNSYVLASIGKNLAENNFSNARQIFIDANFNDVEFFALGLTMLFVKSVIGTCSLLFSNIDNYPIMKKLLRVLLENHQSVNPAESQLNLADIRLFYQGMMSMTGKPHSSETHIQLPDELKHLDRATCAAIQNGLNEMGTHYILATAFSNPNIANDHGVTTPAKATRRKPEKLAIKEIPPEDTPDDQHRSVLRM